MAQQGPMVVTVYFHVEDDGGWSAESPDAPGYMAYAPTLEECRLRALEGLGFFLDRPIAIYDPTVAMVGASGPGLWTLGGGGPRDRRWETDYPGGARFQGVPTGVGLPSDKQTSAA